jgi:hypothetical protein
MNKFDIFVRKTFFYVETTLVGIGAFSVLVVFGFFSGYIFEKLPMWMEALK